MASTSQLRQGRSLTTSSLRSHAGVNAHCPCYQGNDICYKYHTSYDTDRVLTFSTESSTASSSPPKAFPQPMSTLSAPLTVVPDSTCERCLSQKVTTALTGGRVVSVMPVYLGLGYAALGFPRRLVTRRRSCYSGLCFVRRLLLAIINSASVLLAC